MAGRGKVIVEGCKLPEFKRTVLEVMWKPLKDRCITEEPGGHFFLHGSAKHLQPANR
jgi:hypothetical protein